MGEAVHGSCKENKKVSTSLSSWRGRRRNEFVRTLVSGIRTVEMNVRAKPFIDLVKEKRW